MNQMKSFKSDALVLPLYALKGAIPNLNFQSAFTQNGGIERLYLVIHENSEHRQVVYLAVFSLWALSFQVGFNSKKKKKKNHNIFSFLWFISFDELAAIVQKRFSSKVCRVILGFFEVKVRERKIIFLKKIHKLTPPPLFFKKNGIKNMLGRENFNEMLVMFNLYPTLEILQEEKSEDPEFQNSVKNLLEKLVVSVRIMTLCFALLSHCLFTNLSLSFKKKTAKEATNAKHQSSLFFLPPFHCVSMERYHKELESDKLQWGPCHNEAFWKRYAVQFDEDNYKHIKRLIKLLDSPDNETVAVACNDLGEWSRFYPDGKKVIETLKGKQKLMQLIGHKDPNVSKNAIVAVQKMLIRNWKALDQSGRTNDRGLKNLLRFFFVLWLDPRDHFPTALKCCLEHIDKKVEKKEALDISDQSLVFRKKIF
ncbi:hypothetical protein RFI_11821 [Reticulomyxa filosa]|uniref:ATPase V1 complex subunit H C-terminal domain-containing protein n=1 Tax=Reticulomyxa filosa TaxID=46433 RepID=X6NHD6_RETFI|nr:hypothetical protein RFI_11821 [Reticulomyxa filosa]|eukprot:ETO25313.1 hypothetical protein RFI_11821 [Reticulomyxa filosa]